MKTIEDQSGQAYVEFILVLPILLLIVVGVLGFGQQLYTKLAMEAAAWSSTRHAVSTLDADRGIDQAFLATRYTLEGFGLDPDSAQSQIIIWGDWGRATPIRSVVCYEVPAPPVPMGEYIAPQRICAQQTMPTYKWKSRWSE